MTTTSRRRPLGLPKRSPVTITHLCALNDSNGNPRRVFVVRDIRHGFVEAIDEGYEGESAAAGRYPWFSHRAVERLGLERAYIVRYDTTPAEYRAQLKRAGDEGTERTLALADRYARRFDAWGSAR